MAVLVAVVAAARVALLVLTVLAGWAGVVAQALWAAVAVEAAWVVRTHRAVLAVRAVMDWWSSDGFRLMKFQLRRMSTRDCLGQYPSRIGARTSLRGMRQTLVRAVARRRCHGLTSRVPSM